MLRRLAQVLSLETEKPAEAGGVRQLQVCVRERRIDGDSAFEQFLRVVHSRVEQRVQPLASTTGTPRATRLKRPTPCGCRSRRRNPMPSRIRAASWSTSAKRSVPRTLSATRTRPLARSSSCASMRISDPAFEMPPTTIAPAPARCATSAIWIRPSVSRLLAPICSDHFVQALAAHDLEATRLGQPCQQHARHAVRQPGHVLPTSEVVKWHDRNRRSTSRTQSHRHARRPDRAPRHRPDGRERNQQTENRRTAAP